MARPGEFPLSLYRGDSYDWQFVLWEDAAKTIPADLTGVTAKAEIRNAPGGATIMALTTTITLPQTITMHLPASAWGAISLANGAWDLQLTYTDGSVITIVAGTVKIRKDVTDSTPGSLLAAGTTVRRVS